MTGYGLAPVAGADASKRITPNRDCQSPNPARKDTMCRQLREDLDYIMEVDGEIDREDMLVLPRYLGVATCSRRCWACKLTAIWFWTCGLTIAGVLLATLIVLGLEGY